LIILGIGLLFSCKQNEKSENTATVYYGGDIITMVGETPEFAEAIVVKDGEIIFVGTSGEAMSIAGKNHKMVRIKLRDGL
jgi:hypothetical protein